MGMQKKENKICKLMNCKKCERRKVVVTKLVIGSHHVTQGRRSRIELLIANPKSLLSKSVSIVVVWADAGVWI